jgi:hypothetical protein
MEKTEQEIAMVANKTMEIEETMKKQEDEMRTIGRNVAENTHNIEHVKRQVEDRVNGNRNEMELERKRTKEQIEELQKEVDRVRELKGREGEMVTKWICQGDRKIHKFTGNINNLHPMVFIKSINQRIKEIEEGRIDEETKLERIKEIMRENLESEALIWFNGIENDVEDYEQLRNRFLQHFWGDNAQLMVRERLYFGKFNPHISNSLTNYALRLYSLAQYLTPKINEQDLVLYISRQFKQEIAETIAMHDIKTMEHMYNYLTRVERNMPSNYQNSSNMNRNNFQNSSNHQGNSIRYGNRQNDRYQTNFNNNRNHNNFRQNNHYNQNNGNFNNNFRNNNNNFTNRYNNNNNFGNNYDNQRNQNAHPNNNRNFNNYNNDFNHGFRQNAYNNPRRNQYQPSRGEEDVQPRRQVNFQRRRSPSRSEERAEMPINEDGRFETQRSRSLDRESVRQSTNDPQNF